MSQHYRCDVCGDEMDVPASGIAERTFVKGARGGQTVNVHIGGPTTPHGEQMDLCSACFSKAVAQVIGAEVKD